MIRICNLVVTPYQNQKEKYKVLFSIYLFLIGIKTATILKFKVNRSEKQGREKMSGRRRRAERNTQMNDATAATAIQSWFSGNQSRNQMEESRVNNNMDKGGSGASSYQAESRLRRRSTMRLSKVITIKGLCN